MNILLIISHPFLFLISILAIAVTLFIVRAVIKHNKEEAKEKSDIGALTTWKAWDDWNQAPAAKKYPDLMEKAKKKIVQKEMSAIEKMKLPEMLYLCERALPFPSLQFEIKQKIKEFIEKEYKFLDDRRQNKSSDVANYLKRLAQNATRIGATALAMDLNKLEDYYRPPEFAIKVVKKERAEA